LAKEDHDLVKKRKNDRIWLRQRAEELRSAKSKRKQVPKEDLDNFGLTPAAGDGGKTPIQTLN